MTFMRHIILLVILLVPSHVMAEQDAPIRSITLKDIIYKSPTDWEITLNDQKITAQSPPPRQVTDLQVSADKIRLKWFDSQLDGVVDVRLEPFQTYDIDSNKVKPVTTNPPEGMTVEEWDWVQEVIAQSLTFTGSNYQKELQSSSKNFTAKGWEQITKEIVDNKLLERGEGDFSITASLKSPPLLVQTGELGGTQTWLFKASLSLLYKAGSEIRMLRSEKNVLIERTAGKTPALAISGWATVKPVK
ncbi:MAG: DotI/IcmL/TraM family protein [bacterium]|nr:DotI/IcmL/TraM family protein [bacterium]